MSSVHVDWELDTTPAAPRTVLAGPLVAIVGFDGSPAAHRALQAASQLISGRDGHVEVVYVAHMPVSAAVSADAESEIRKGFDDLEREYSLDIRTLLGHAEQRWHFQRRDGAVAHELVTAAESIRHQYGADATIVIVVGSSVHRYHQVIGSIPVNLARQAKFPLLVVPSVQDSDRLE